MTDISKIKKGNNSKLYVTLGIVVFILLLIGFIAKFDGWLDAKITDHKAVMELGKELECTQKTVSEVKEELKEMNKQLKEINRQLARLLMDEYP